jgi:hypothetical protein
VATTDSEGRYRIILQHRPEHERQGSYTVIFSKTGYETRIVNLDKGDGGDVKIRSSWTCNPACRIVDVVLTPEK